MTLDGQQRKIPSSIAKDSWLWAGDASAIGIAPRSSRRPCS